MPPTRQAEPTCVHGHFSTIMFNDRPFCLECGRFLDIAEGLRPGQPDHELRVQEGHSQATHGTGEAREIPAGRSAEVTPVCSYLDANGLSKE